MNLSKYDNENNKVATIGLGRKFDIIKKPKGKITDIINFYDIIPKKYTTKLENPNYEHHKIELPFRMCVNAPSGSGKTNFLLNLIKIFSMGKGTFPDITIVTANKDEPLYNWLEHQSDNIKILEGINSTPKLDDYDKEYNHLLVWDDMVLCKNLDDVQKYYIRARKKNVSVIFLSQSYAAIPSKIRKNSTHLVLFDLGGSKREQNYIMNEWASNLDKDELRAIYEDATKENLQPLIIKGGKTAKNEKYRKSFGDYYNLDEFLKNIERTLPKSRRRVKKSKKEIIIDSSDSE